MTIRNVNVDELKERLKNTTFEKIGKGLCGLTDGNGKDHSQPCPFCEGKNRFWYSADCDRWFCRKCKATGGWDAIGLVMQKYGVDFKEAVRLVAEATGYVGYGVTNKSRKTESPCTGQCNDGKPIPFLDTFRLDADSLVFKATALHRPDILFDDYQRAGAKLFRDGIAIPMFDTDGIESGWVRYFQSGGKPKLIGKSGIVGIDAIYNLRTAKSAKIVFKTAGVSDYLVLSGVIERLELAADFYCFTNGAGEGELPGKFETLLCQALAGQAVGVIQDNDEAGESGALRWAESLAEYAADVRIIQFPDTPDCRIKDVRDWFSRAKWIGDSLEENGDLLAFFRDMLPDKSVLFKDTARMDALYARGLQERDTNGTSGIELWTWLLGTNRQSDVPVPDYVVASIARRLTNID